MSDLDKLLELYLHGHITKDEYKEMLERLK